jgi:hypothetical protein
VRVRPNRAYVLFLFSPELMNELGWEKGQPYDLKLDQEGGWLVIEPYKRGRLMGEYNGGAWRKGAAVCGALRFGYPVKEVDRVSELMGFNVLEKQFWDIYQVDGDRLLLKMEDRNKVAT